MNTQKTKAQKTCLYYLLIIISTLFISACTRYTPPVESFAASESGINSEQQQNGDKETEKKDPKKVQAEFDEFTNQVFKDELSSSPLSLHCFVRHPENFGIEVTEMTLGTLSLEDMKEAYDEMKLTKEKLESFDTGQLTSDQVFTYNMFLDYLNTELTSEGMELYLQPLSPTIGTQAQLPVLLAEYSFYSKKDVEDYLTLLSGIDDYYKELADFEKAKADAGLAPSDITLDRIIQSCKNYMIRPESSFLTETFNDKLEGLTELTDAEKNEYKDRHTTILKEHFIPAYQNLAAALEELKGSGVNENGLAHFKDGKKYYEYLVSSMTGTSLSVPELRKKIEKQTGSDMADISLLVQNNPELLSQTSGNAFTLNEPTEILNSLKEESTADFPELANSTFTVKMVPKALESSLSPAFFLIPPIDDYENGTIYINGLAEQTAEQLYTTLAHEGYPGHLYQTLYFSQKESCPLRHLIGCGGYSEGWGTYAEVYSYSFNNGLSDEVKKLLACNRSATLALYSILDIHINYDGWDLAKTSDFLVRYYGITDPEVIKEVFESIIDNPANYLKYYSGYLDFCSLRDTAQTTLGDRYDAKAFHKFLLDMEGASFRVIEPYFQTWLLTYDIKK